MTQQNWPSIRKTSYKNTHVLELILFMQISRAIKMLPSQKLNFDTDLNETYAIS